MCLAAPVTLTSKVLLAARQPACTSSAWEASQLGAVTVYISHTCLLCLAATDALTRQPLQRAAQQLQPSLGAMSTGSTHLACCTPAGTDG